MAIGELDIAVQVDASSAVAGFNKAAAANERFLQSLIDAADPLAKINRDIATVEKMQQSGARSAEDYAKALGELKSRAAALSGELTELGNASQSSTAGIDAANAANQRLVSSLADIADPMRRIEREIAAVKAAQAAGGQSADAYAAALGQLEQRAAAVQAEIAGTGQAAQASTAGMDAAAKASQRWVNSLLDVADPIRVVEREIAQLNQAFIAQQVGAQDYFKVLGLLETKLLEVARETDVFANATNKMAADAAAAAAANQRWVNSLLDSSDGTRKVQREIAQLNALHAAGEVSAEDHARGIAHLNSELARVQEAALRAGNGMGSFSAEGKGASRMMRATSAQATNLFQQIQDIGIVAAMGQDPFTVMIQQGSQIAAVMGPLGASGALATFKGALMQIFNPMTALTLAAVYLGTVLIQTFMKGHESAEDMEKAAKKTRTEIAELAKGFPQLEANIGKFSRTAIAAFSAITAKAKSLAGTLPEEIKKAFAVEAAGAKTPFMGLGSTTTLITSIDALKGLTEASADIPGAESKVNSFFEMLDDNLMTAKTAAKFFEESIGAGAHRGLFSRTGQATPQDQLSQQANDIAEAIKVASGGSQELEDILSRQAKAYHDGTFSAATYQKELEALWRTTDKGNTALRERLVALIAANDAAVQAEDEQRRLNNALEYEEYRLGLSAEAWRKHEEGLRASIETAERGLSAFESLVEAAAPDLTPIQNLMKQRDEMAALIPSGAKGIADDLFLQSLAEITELSPRMALAMEQVNAAMEAHDQVVQGLVASYPELASATQTFIPDIITKAQQLVTLNQQLETEQAALGAAINAFMGDLAEAGSSFGPFQAAIDTFKASVAAGKPDVLALGVAVSQIMANDPTPEIQAMGTALLTALGPMIQMAAQAYATAGGVGALGGAASSTAGLLRDLTAATNEFNAARATMGSIGVMPLTEEQQITAQQNKMLEAAGQDLIMRQAANDAAEKQLATLKQTRETQEQMRLDALKGRGGGGGKGGGGGGGGAAALDADQQWVQSLLDAADPMRQINADMERLNTLMAAGKITAEDFAAAMNLLKKRAGEAGETATETFDAAAKFGEIMDSWGQQVASSLADAIVEGENLEDVFKDLLKQLLKMIIQMMILEPLMKSLTGGMGGGGGGGGDFMSAMMGAITGGMSAAKSVDRSFQGISRSMRSMGNLNPLAGGIGVPANRNGNGTGTVVQSSSTSMGNMTINFGMGGSKGDAAKGDDQRSTQFAKRVRDMIQGELVRQQRPGGILWGG